MSKILYQSQDEYPEIKVTDFRSPEEHELFIDEEGEFVSFILPRGYVKEYSRKTSDEIWKNLFSTNQNLAAYLIDRDISWERFARVLSHTRINELEDEVSYFIEEYNRSKELIE